MPVLYNGNSIIPAPMVSVTKEYQSTTDGEKVGAKFRIILNGLLYFAKGSPDKDGNFHTGSGYPADDTFTDVGNEAHTAMLKKQEALRELFSQDGLLLEFVTWETTGPSSLMKTYPVVKNINLEGSDPSQVGWWDRIPYTIELEANEIEGLTSSEDDFGGIFLESAEETWNLETNEQPQGFDNPYVFRLTHNVSAQGKIHYKAGGPDGKAWEQARKWVLPRLGIDNTIALAGSGLNLGNHYSGYNHIRSENTDEKAGRYAVTESWVISSGSVTEDFTVSITTSEQDARTRVGIQGTITGLDIKDNDLNVTQSRWDSALAHFNSLAGLSKFYTRARDVSGVTNLNTNTLNTTVGKNPNTGVITYNYDFDNGPSNCIPGSLFEEISITEVGSNEVFASIAVPGRAAGPVLQAMNTITTKSFGVNVEVVMPAATGCVTDAASASAYLSYRPNLKVLEIIEGFQSHLTDTYDQVFVTNDQVQWKPKTGRYSRNVTWAYQNCT